MDILIKKEISFFFTSHEYSRGVMEIVAKNTHVYYFSYRDIPADLEETGRKAVKAFGIKDRFFHIEFFRRKDGKIICLEVNIRPPGGYTMDMFNFANDFDLYMLWAEVVTGKRATIEYTRPWHVCYISRKNHIKYKHTHEEVLACKHSPSVVFKSLVPSGMTIMGDYAYIFRVATLEELHQFTSYIWELEEGATEF